MIPNTVGTESIILFFDPTAIRVLDVVAGSGSCRRFAAEDACGLCFGDPILRGDLQELGLALAVDVNH